MVTTTNQEVDTDGDCSLQEAIFAANYDINEAIDPTNLNGPHITTGCSAGSGADTIVLQTGAVYVVGAITQSQFNIAGLSANPDIRSTITIQGNGARLERAVGQNLRAFVVNSAPSEVCEQTNAERIAAVTGTKCANGNLTIQNLHIKGFSAKGGDGADGGGGGMGAGGAIYVRKGTLTVDNATFENNTATGGNGGPDATTVGGGGGGGLGGDGRGEGTGGDFRGGGGGGGSRGSGGTAGASGGGGGGTGNDGVVGGVTVGGNGGFNCGGKGGRFAGSTNPPSSTGGNGFCTGGGAGGGAAGPTDGTDVPANPPGDIPSVLNGSPGGIGNYGGGGGGGGSTSSAGASGGNGGAGGFGGGGAAGGNATTGTNGAGGDGGFGGGGGRGAGAAASGAGGSFAGAGVPADGGGGGAGLGGAIFNDSGNVTVRNSTFSGNTATGGLGAGANNGTGAGGAVFSRDGSTKFYNSTISGNTATGSGGIYIFGSSSAPSPTASFIIRNSIVFGNGATGCFVDTVGGTPTVALAGSGNLIGNNGAGAAACPAVVSTADPVLGPLQLNAPGNTPTMAILSTSPAYNTGDNAACLATDQRGVARPQGPGCDIGAYEVEIADLSITKTSDSAEVLAGEPLFYSIHVHNFGPGAAESAVVTDILPLGAFFLADTAPTAPAGGCTVGPSGTANAAVTTTDTTLTDTRLALTVDAYIGRTVRAGGKTLRVTSNTATTFTGASWSGLGNPGGGAAWVVLDGTVTCNLAPIPNGGDVDFKIKVLVPSDFVQLEADGTRTLANTATIAGVVDTKPANNTSTASTFVTDEADLKVTKYSEPVDTAPAGGNTTGGGAIAGVTIVYTILVDNLGPSAARDVVIFDTLLNSSLVKIQSCAFSVSQGGGTITQFSCTTGDVVVTQFGSGVGRFSTNHLAPFGADSEGSQNPTGRLRASFRLLVEEGADVSNLTRVSSATHDPYSSNNESSVNIKVTPVSDLALTKIGPAGPVAPGQNVTYTMTVTNNGPSTASNVVVKDDLPSQVAVVSVTSAGNSCTNGVPGDALQPLTCNMGTLAKAASEQITVVVKVKAGTPGDTILVNQARVSSANADPDNSNNSQSVTTTVAATPPAQSPTIMFLTKPGTPAAGQAFATNLVVAIVDAGGSVVATGAAALIELAIAVNPPGGALTCKGGLTASTVNGLATFKGCSISKAGVGYTLVATALPNSALGQATTAPFTVARQSTEIVLTASEPTITWGEMVKFSVHFMTDGGNRTFRLEGARDPSKPANFALIADLTTDKKGDATFSYRPATTLYYRAVFDGTPDVGSATSPLRRVMVRQIAILRPTNKGGVKSIGVGTSITFTTTVRPSRPELAPATVTYKIYQLVGGVWTLAQTNNVTATAAGLARLTVTFSTAGKWYVRSMANPTPYNANSVSSPLERYDVN